MEYTTVKNLVWVNPEKTAFDCDVYFSQYAEELPFTCSQHETQKYPHVGSIWSRAMNGDFGVIAEFVPPVEVDPSQPQPVVDGAQTL